MFESLGCGVLGPVNTSMIIFDKDSSFGSLIKSKIICVVFHRQDVFGTFICGTDLSLTGKLGCMVMMGGLPKYNNNNNLIN